MIEKMKEKKEAQSEGGDPLPPTKPKTDGFRAAPADDKLLITIENLTSHRGFEKVQELYFIILGIDPSGNAGTVKSGDGESVSLLDRVLPEGLDASKFFFNAVTPIFKIRRRRQHDFPGGLPLFYGVPGDLISIYLAVVESDRGARELGQALGQMPTELPEGLVGGNLTAAFPWLIKSFEMALLHNKDDIRYTNVFTFRERDDFMAGTHSFSNQRVSLTMSVDAPEF